jgi:hypothetical protein
VLRGMSFNLGHFGELISKVIGIVNCMFIVEVQEKAQTKLYQKVKI